MSPCPAPAASTRRTPSRSPAERPARSRSATPACRCRRRSRAWPSGTAVPSKRRPAAIRPSSCRAVRSGWWPSRPTPSWCSRCSSPRLTSRLLPPVRRRSPRWSSGPPTTAASTYRRGRGGSSRWTRGSTPAGGPSWRTPRSSRRSASTGGGRGSSCPTGREDGLSPPSRRTAGTEAGCWPEPSAWRWRSSSQQRGGGGGGPGPRRRDRSPRLPRKGTLGARARRSPEPRGTCCRVRWGCSSAGRSGCWSGWSPASCRCEPWPRQRAARWCLPGSAGSSSLLGPAATSVPSWGSSSLCWPSRASRWRSRRATQLITGRSTVT